jgi:MFS family permease
MKLPGQRLSRTVRDLALVVGCVFFMEQLDTTILASVLPTLAHDLRVPPADMNLALVAYLVSQCVYIPASGWFADRYGTRTVLLLAITVFAAGSLLCAISPSLPVLVVARIIQGVGGSMMLPVGRLVLLRSATAAERLDAMAMVLLPGMLGPALGPAIGGLIVTWLSWHVVSCRSSRSPNGGASIGWVLPPPRPASS